MSKKAGGESTTTTRRTSAPMAAGKPAKLPAMPSTMVTTARRSEEHTSELQSLMRISYAFFCLKKTKPSNNSSLSSLVYIYNTVLYRIHYMIQHYKDTNTH